MATGKIKIFFTRANPARSGNYGFGFIAQENGPDIWFHANEAQTLISALGEDNLKGVEVVFDIREGDRGPQAVNLRTAAQEAARAEHRAAEEARAAARRIQIDVRDGVLYLGQDRVRPEDLSALGITLKQVGHDIGRTKLKCVRRVDRTQQEAWLQDGDESLEEFVQAGVIYRRTCVACHLTLLTDDPERLVHQNSVCEEGDQPHRWEVLLGLVAEDGGDTSKASLSVDFPETRKGQLTLRVQIGDKVWTSEALLADRCPDCGDQLEEEVDDENIRHSVCVCCGRKAKLYPIVRQTTKGWEVLLRAPKGKRDEGFGWLVSVSGITSLDSAKSPIAPMEAREQMAQLLTAAGADQRYVLAAGPVKPDPTARLACPHCGAPVLSFYKARRSGRRYGYSHGGGMRMTDSEGDVYYSESSHVSSAQVSSGTYYKCPHGCGTWWDSFELVKGGEDG